MGNPGLVKAVRNSSFRYFLVKILRRLKLSTAISHTLVRFISRTQFSSEIYGSFLSQDRSAFPLITFPQQMLILPTPCECGIRWWGNIQVEWIYKNGKAELELLQVIKPYFKIIKQLFDLAFVIF